MVIIHYEVEYDMNRIVSLSEIRKDKVSSINNLLEISKEQSIQENSKELYVEFEKRFCLINGIESYCDLDYRKINRTNYRIQINEIIEKVFLVENKIILINFINSLYNEGFGMNTKIERIKDDNIINNNHIIIIAEDEYRRFEYKIELINQDNENMAVLITRVSSDDNYNNVINFNKNKRKYSKNNEEYTKEDSLINYSKCLIVLDSNIQVPDVYEAKLDTEKNINNKIRIIKSWKYDFKKLFENSMYLLFPMKVIDLKKELLSIEKEIISKDLIIDIISRFFKDMNKYLRKIKDLDLITGKDIIELNSLSIDLLNYYIKETTNVFNNIGMDIETKIKDIVV
jgi:hypothetical protein